MSLEIIHGDCLEVLPTLAAGSVDCVVTDPPYFKVKADAWDRQWANVDEFLAWQGRVLDECRRVLAPNGSVYWFCSPRLERATWEVFEQRFSVLNRIVWAKPVSWADGSCKAALRAYFPASETILFGEQYGADSRALGESRWAEQCDDLRGFVFEPLRAYLDSERRRAGCNYEDVRGAVGCAAGSGLPGHWFTQSQWQLPTPEHYEALRRLFNERGNGAGQYLRRDYEDLRRDYEDLRRPFSAEADRPYTDVWMFATVNHYPGKHPCEKPLPMMEHILQTSMRPGGTVLDPFLGSGTTLVAAAKLGLNGIGIEQDAGYCEIARARVAAATEQLRLEVSA